MEFTVRTSKKRELIDITDSVREAVASSRVASGICLAYVPHATAGILVNEFEPNIALDFEETLARLFPEGDYRHNRIDDNAEAHLKAGFIGPGATIPIENGAPALGTWQRIVLCEFDGPRSRRVLVKVVEGK